MRYLLTLLFALGGMTLAKPALSACTWGSNGAPKNDTYQINVPSSLTISRVPVGGILASHSQKVGLNDSMRCYTGEKMATMTLDIGLQASKIPNVYETGVPGIGIRVLASRTAPASREDYYNFPGQFLFDDLTRYLPTMIYVDYVRTEIAVGSGQVPATFTARFILPSNSGLTPSTLTYTSTGSTKLENNVFFSSCESQEPTKIVPMGKVATSNIKSGTALEQRYTFEVRCRGMKPATPLPMKIYFEGNTDANGMLNLTSAGQAGVAQGVAIELKDDKGTKLPFNKPDAINMDWQRSEVDAEVYRFSGSARYTASGGEIKPGKADATMTYVLDYN